MARFQVYQTDADLSTEPQSLGYQSESADVAATVMDRMFMLGYPAKSYLLYDTQKREVIQTRLSPKVMVQRGEV